MARPNNLGSSLTELLTNFNGLVFDDILGPVLGTDSPLNLQDELQTLLDSLSLDNIDDFLAGLEGILTSITGLATETVTAILNIVGEILNLLASLVPDLPDLPDVPGSPSPEGILGSLVDLVGTQVAITVTNELVGTVQGELLFVGNDYAVVQEADGGLTYILPDAIQSVGMLGGGV
ncbi:hypothetical protein [Priestia filamentosa]|uniref:hypothetical protein n=1 Tax=Priestia filamentosa TaxID=1402861 RepID=UPI000E749731|nr:hypothetical protein [Priestia filamentosa]RJS62790.1 hypothetical protein CJ485_24880 [Priestia filamentosa]